MRAQEGDQPVVRRVQVAQHLLGVLRVLRPGRHRYALACEVRVRIRARVRVRIRARVRVRVGMRLALACEHLDQIEDRLAARLHHRQGEGAARLVRVTAKDRGRARAKIGL